MQACSQDYSKDRPLFDPEVKLIYREMTYFGSFFRPDGTPFPIWLHCFISAFGRFQRSY